MKNQTSCPLLNVWDFFHQLKSELSRSQLKKACGQNFLSYPLMRQWQDIHRQLLSMARQQKLQTRSRKDDYDAVHRSLLSGLLSGVALLTDRHEYTGAGNVKFQLWPGSGIFSQRPKWVMVAEIVETSRQFGRTAAKISPDWIEPLAQHLTKHRYYDPHWSRKRQSVMASENVTLFGIPIVNGRKVGYARIDPEVSRDLFIEHGLVEDEFVSNHGFLEHNRWLLEQIKAEADKTRDRDLIVDPLNLIAFYQAHLPAEAVDPGTLKSALKSDASLDQRLRMTRADVLPGSDVGDLESSFPDQVNLGSMSIPVKYRFEPGADDDGASIQIPIEGIGQLDDVQTGWMVPGLMESRIVALIRSLPKSLRRNLVPAPDTARELTEKIEFGKGRFIDAVAGQLSRIGGLPISETDFKLEKLDPHLHVNLQVVDETGDILAQGRSIGELREQLGAEQVSNIVEVENEQWNQDGLKDWTWDEFPREISIRRGATELAAFPTIVDQDDAVGLRLSDSANASDLSTREGLVRLFQLTNRRGLKSQVNWLPDLDRHAMLLQRLQGASDLKTQLIDLIARVGFVATEKIPRNRKAFEAIQQNAGERMGIAAQEIARWLPKFADAVHSVQLKLSDLSQRFGSTKHDVSQQIQALTGPGFLRLTPWQWLRHYPRYFQAIDYRLEKRSNTASEKDAEFSAQLQHYWEQYEQLTAYHQQHAIVDAELETFRWMIEELRVSLFAQPLGTAIKVSPQRMEKQWAKIRKT